jgi:hypothetical protein
MLYHSKQNEILAFSLEETFFLVSKEVTKKLVLKGLLDEMFFFELTDRCVDSISLREK